MNASSRRFATLLCGLVSLVVLPAQAVLREVEVFDSQSWQKLQATLKQPAAVVFTTTDCAYCPAAMEQVARGIRERKLKATLIAVVMDVAPGESNKVLLSDKHYRLATRLFAFSGQAPRIRYSINPAWRGVTPYVAFLIPGAQPVWVTGPPSEADVLAWDNAMATSRGQAP